MTESERGTAHAVATGVYAGLTESGRHWVNMAFYAVIAITVLSIAFSFFSPTDSTDYSRTDRSGLKLHTDAMTGCQYLSTSGGGITPRLDNRGHHVCQHTTPATAKDKE